jgi:PAS domain S-box-containing protein
VEFAIYVASVGLIVFFGEAMHRAQDRVRREAADRKMAEDAEREQKELLRVTLASIGDGAITTDNQARVTYLNPVAEALTGWTLSEAAGRPLTSIFRIVNEQTRLPVENPVERVLVEGKIVGLSNHTVLIDKDGAERPIDDSAAPIRDADGRTRGVVLVFRDVTERRKAEQARRRLAAIVESSHDAIISKDLEGIILSWNRGAEQLYGYSAAEVVGGSIALLVPPDHPDELPAILQRLKQGERIDQFETVRVRKDGTRVDVSINFSPVRDEAGQIIGASKIARDITTTKQVEKVRRQAEAQLHLVTDTMAAPVARCSRDLRYLWVSQPYADWMGRPADQIVGRPIEEIVGPKAYAQLAPYFQQVLGGQRVRYEEQVNYRGLGQRWIDATYTPTFDQAGAVDGWVAVVVDIEDRKRSEANLRRKNERLALVSEAAAVLLHADDPDPMLQRLFAKIAPHFGLDSYFNYMVDENGQALRLVSCAGIDALTANRIKQLDFGQAVVGRVAISRQPIVATQIQNSSDPMVQLVKSFGIRSYACNPLMPGDRLLGTLSFASRSRDQFENDELEFFRTICHYVAVAYERLRLVGELRTADRRKDEFLAALADELRNLLAPIRSSITELRAEGTGDRGQETGPSDEKVTRCRENIDCQASQMGRLLDDLLDVSRIAGKKLELHRERVTLADILQSALKTTRPHIDAQRHQFIVLLPAENLWVDVDAERLGQVFIMLLDNAAKYTEPGGKISLIAERQESDAVITVADSGIGIAPEMLPRMFEMFLHAPGPSARSRGGLGIGLALAKGLVQMHGGSMYVASDGPGKGTTFQVRLPVLSGEAAPPWHVRAEKGVSPLR